MKYWGLVCSQGRNRFGKRLVFTGSTNGYTRMNQRRHLRSCANSRYAATQRKAFTGCTVKRAVKHAGKRADQRIGGCVKRVHKT